MKVEDILSGGYKRRHQRGPRKGRIAGIELAPIKLREGGNFFDDAVPFDHAKIPAIMKQVNSVLAQAGVKALPIGSGATPTPGKMSGDLDMIVDADALANHFKSTDIKEVRKQLRAMFDAAGMQTGQSGVSVHVRAEVGGEAHQVDIMIVVKAAIAQKFHIHNIPQGSKFKGVHKMLALAKLAKEHNLLWSPYEGLWTRGPDGKKNKFYTDDLDKIAQTLLGPNATGKDLGSLESIMAALGPKGEQLLADLRDDPSWVKV
jgi:hypothetical protein